jgi:hypothetical protein
MEFMRNYPGHRTWKGRSQMVRQVLMQWRRGLPIRTAAKILRKAGIHPWSLAAGAQFGDLERLTCELRLPTLVLDACHHFTGQGLGFQNVNKPLRLPEGLVMEQLLLSRCLGIRRLPGSLWVKVIRAESCERIESLSHRGEGLSSFRAEHCTRLRHLDLKMKVGGSVVLVDCLRITALPNVSRLSRLLLKDMPSLSSLGRVAEVDRLSLWRLPGISNLSGLKVNQGLVIQDCRSLRRLPDVDPEIQG